LTLQTTSIPNQSLKPIFENSKRSEATLSNRTNSSPDPSREMLHDLTVYHLEHLLADEWQTTH
jgi:hypothetical protein